MKRLARNSVWVDRYIHDLVSGCYIWIGAVTSAGYGSMWYKGKAVATHRHAYEKVYGPITKGLQIMHLCGNRKCVNPKHLTMGTQSDNEDHKRNHGTFNHRRHIAQEKCKRGHWIIGPNADVWIEKNGHNHCNICRRIVQRIRAARIRGEINAS